MSPPTPVEVCREVIRRLRVEDAVRLLEAPAMAIALGT
jgi:hypothetical protein